MAKNKKSIPDLFSEKNLYKVKTIGASTSVINHEGKDLNREAVENILQRAGIKEWRDPHKFLIKNPHLMFRVTEDYVIVAWQD